MTGSFTAVQDDIRNFNYMVSIEQVKELREETGVSISECKNALEEANGDSAKAKEILRKLGKELANKKASRDAGSGIVKTYVHPNNKVGAMVELRCETDFVAKSDDFKNLANELCLQITAMNPEGNDDLLSQEWVKDNSKTIQELVEEYVAKIGENIVLKKFIRYEI